MMTSRSSFSEDTVHLAKEVTNVNIIIIHQGKTSIPCFPEHTHEGDIERAKQCEPLAGMDKQSTFSMGKLLGLQVHNSPVTSGQLYLKCENK